MSKCVQDKPISLALGFALFNLPTDYVYKQTESHLEIGRTADRVLSYWQKTVVLCLGRSLSTHFDCSGGFRNIMESAVL